MKILILIIVLNLFLLNSYIDVSQNSLLHKNGTIIEKIVGFPYRTYDQWLQDYRNRYLFDETEFKKKFPPKDFKEYRERINCPFETYDQWIQALKKRSQSSQFDETTFRNKYKPDDFMKFQENIDFMKIKYMSDGLKIGGFILKPRISKETKFPVIIFNRGGNQDIAMIDFEKLYNLFYLVSQGYVLVASQYRGCSESEGRDEIGGKDVNDVLSLIPLIDSLPYADSTRIGMYGWSRGGMMTYLALTKTSRIIAAVIGAGPTDFLSNVKKRPKAEDLFADLISDYSKNREEILRSRSAIYWPDKIHKKTPILLLQGSADWRTDPADVLRMASRLYEINHPMRFVFFEGGDHGLSQFKKEVDALVLDWFNKHIH